MAIRTTELRESNQQLELALAAAHLGIWEYEAPTGRLSWSERQTIMFGLRNTQHCRMLRDLRPIVHPEDRRDCLRALHRSLRDGVTFDQVYRVIWPDDSEHWLHSMGRPTLRTKSEARKRLIGTTRDITALMEHQNQLERMAHYDALTSLPNRVLLSARLQQAMANARRRERCLGVIYLDLDGFKSINDTHGHTLGDELLITVSGRMRRTLREVDTLARLGGDEFAAILVDLCDRDACGPLVERLLAAAAEPVELDGRRLQVTASLGITFYPQATEVDGDQLLRQADQAMYRAKQSGKNRYQVFENTL
nr:sensor domain-containing diguanylate cyclase [Imhoffiella purpurea]